MKTNLSLDTLAHLAAQARFAKLSSANAVHAALDLWRAADEALRHEEMPMQATTPQPQPAAKPKDWPAPLHVFYRLIVKGRHEGDSESRLMHFLPQYVLKTSIRLRGASDQEATEDAKKCLSYWKENKLDEATWNWLAGPFSQWWHDVGRKEGKRRGGKEAAKMADKKRKKGKAVQRQK